MSCYLRPGETGKVKGDLYLIETFVGEKLWLRACYQAGLLPAIGWKPVYSRHEARASRQQRVLKI